MATVDKYLDVNTEIENLKNAVVKVCFFLAVASFMTVDA
jgi:hypothetical protein